MTPDDRFKLEDEELSIFSIMASLRDYTFKVSSSFLDRVSRDLDATVEEEGPGVTKLFTGVLVQVLNLCSELMGVEERDDNNKLAGGESDPPSEDER